MMGCGVLGHIEKLRHKLPAQWKRRPAVQTGSMILPTGNDKLFANIQSAPGKEEKIISDPKVFMPI